MRVTNEIKKDLRALANTEKAKILQSFFKTGNGEYGEGDIFLGLNSQQIRDVASKHSKCNIETVKELLSSKIHEDRVCGLRILNIKFKENKQERKTLFEFYLRNTGKINNWDLVDISSYFIVGEYLKDKDRGILYKLAKSQDIWERRISIVSTLAFIRNNNLEETLKISEILLRDKHDLIHKAVGWMLREVGKRDKRALCKFLEENKNKMPRTMLRYSIEKFSKEERVFYMKK